MSTVVIKRSPRRPAPEIPSGDLVVQAPPQIPPVPPSRWQQLVQVVPMLTGTLATALLFAGRDGGTYSYVIGAVFGFSTLGMLLTSAGAGGGPKKAEMMAARRDYLRHLAALRRQVRDTAARQRAGLHYRHPDPGALWSTVDSYRLWERRPTDSDFAVVRVAVGPQTLATPLHPPLTGPLEDLEPLTAGALRRFLDACSVVSDLPVAISLRSFARVHVSAEPSQDGAAPALVRAMLAQLAVFHAPEDLLIAVCVAAHRRERWEWVKWLPHTMHPTRTDAVGPVRLVAGSAVELEGLLDDLLANRARFAADRPADRGAGPRAAPHLVVVLDGGDLAGSGHLGTDGGVDGVTLIDLDGAPSRLLDPTAIVLDPSGGRLAATSVAADGDPAAPGASIGVPDALAAADVEALARRLAPLRLAVAAGTDDANANRDTRTDLAALLALDDPWALDVTRAWAPRPHRDRLRVPIGVGPQGQPVEIDLKESAQDGMGPHGLVIGATGSGKSELLRTLVLGLAATHSSETLNFVLIDFKGGATFARLDRLPHVAAFITNLEAELPLVDRMTDAINGEVVRRQELLRRAGDHDSVRDYEQARAGGAPLAPLPSLLVVCDEFSELLEAKPDFIDLFVQIGRVGRSLGVHLLLASQRLEEGRLRGLDTHLSYRVGLRTFSSLESRTVLGVPDAYELPRSPGHGYLKSGTEPLTRFKAAYVSGAHRQPGRLGAAGGAGRRVTAYDTWFVPPAAPMEAGDEPPGTASLLDVLVDRLVGQGVPAHQVWLPPLGAAASLDELLGPVAVEAGRGLSVADPRLRGALQVPVALVDKPLLQRRDVLWLNLDSANGHVAVVGGTQSGKSVALRTLIVGLALTHTPAEIQVYCLDFGGGQLLGLRDLPHVGGVAGRLDPAAVRRTVGEVAALLNDRERHFAEAGVDSMATYRRRRATARTADAAVEAGGDVFLVIDGWATIRGEYDDIEGAITDIATRGLSYGIHVAASASRWMDFRPALRDLLGSRIELRLGDESDSLASRKAAANVPKEAPGRGVTADGLHLLVACPKLARGEQADLVKAVAAAWQQHGTGAVAPRVRLLPALVPHAAVAGDADPANPLDLPIGIAETDLRPARVDFGAEPHLLVFGDAGSGKSTLLRGLAATISDRFAPEEARIVLVDHRRSLLGAVHTEHLIGYGTGAQQTEDLIASVADYMRRRLPGPDVTQDQLRSRGWWTGPECFVLVDDYDLVVTGSGNPLDPLLPYLAQARDVGLHLVVARRSGGAARALFEPVLQRLRELSSPGLVLSGDREEGALLGNVRPGPLPPGRGWLVTRRDGARLVQVAHVEAG